MLPPSFHLFQFLHGVRYQRLAFHRQPDRGTALRTDELHAKQQLVGIEGNLVIAHRARDGLFGIDHDLFEIVGFLLADADAGAGAEAGGGTATGWMALV